MDLDDKATICLPSGDRVMQEWFAAQGIEASLSIAGRLAANMLYRFGPHGLHLLRAQQLVDLLRERAGRPGPIPFGRLRSLAAAAATAPGTPEGWLQRLVDSQIIALGAQVKCQTCGRKPWYPIDKLGYTVTCAFCHSEIAFPQNRKPGEWAYRFLGPFDVQGETVGACTVLLLRGLLGELFADDQITAVPGLDIVIDGKPYEIDLVAMLKPSSTRSPAMLVFAECKAGDRIDDRDIERREVLATRFPRSLLVFASLAVGLERNTVRRLDRLITRLSRSRFRGSCGHVLVLCRDELLFEKRGPGSDLFHNAGMNRGRETLRWQGSWTDLCTESQRVHLDRTPPRPEPGTGRDVAGTRG